eukprot:g5899.t1
MMRAFLVSALLASAVADVYMHSPRGSNDRNCERNVNRNNGNRLFDSQNNAKGGYACPRAVGAGDNKAQLTDRLYYYQGSVLPIEWTNQHGCGPNSKVNCEIIIQYACEDTLDTLKTFRAENGAATKCADANMPGYCAGDNRNAWKCTEKADPSDGCIAGSPRDGQPTNNNDAATDRMPLNRANAFPTSGDPRRYGMHENYDFYQDCRSRARNKGLFTADQNVNNNIGATGTRQNPNGNRNGLECPEERDYYPYWHPSPWRDIAVLTNQGTEFDAAGNPKKTTTRCAYYKAESQNVKARGECLVLDGPNGAVLTGPQAQTKKTTIRPDANGRRWYNNNEKPPVALEAKLCAKNPANADKAAAEQYKDSCYCAKVRGEDVNWVESRFSYGFKDDPTKGTPAPPDCVQTQNARVNQLGNAADDDRALPPMARADGKVPHGTNANRYLWKIPADVENKNCVIRLRYNISTEDYLAWHANGTVGGQALTARANSGRRRRRNKIDGTERSPITQDPYARVTNASIAGGQEEFVSMAVNTNQYGRTFQDRSYVFEIRRRPVAAADAAAQSGLDLATWTARRNAGDVNIVQQIPATADVINLGVRGKRGNIVQTYPAVEYDFMPSDLQLAQNDFVHFQWTGSDYNPRRGCNNGEGGPPDPPNDVNAAKQNSRADRSNIMDVTAAAHNLPDDITGKRDMTGTTLFSEADGSPRWALMRKMAYLGQTERLSATVDPNTGVAQKCLSEQELNNIGNKNQRENHPRNCAKLNAAHTPYFDGGAVQMRGKGQFAFFSSRNNNFSNRDQTGKICVGLTGAECRGTDNPSVLAALKEDQTRVEQVIAG